MDEAHTERKRFDRGLLRITPGGGLIQRGKEGFGLAPQPPIGSCALWPPGIRSRGAHRVIGVNEAVSAVAAFEHRLRPAWGRPDPPGTRQPAPHRGRDALPRIGDKHFARHRAGTDRSGSTGRRIRRSTSHPGCSPHPANSATCISTRSGTRVPTRIRRTPGFARSYAPSPRQHRPAAGASKTIAGA